jgi:hypothetical protein
MARHKPKIIDNRSVVEKLADQARQRAANEQANEPLVPVEAQQHGDYAQAAQTGELRKAMVNRSVNPFERWRARGDLSDTQIAAILHCQRLWDCAGGPTGLTANYEPRIAAARYGGDTRQLEALDDLSRIKGYFVFPMDRYYQVFENVCRFDEPAGVAGSKIERKSHGREHAARLVVGFVADIIYQRERLTY